MTKFWREGHFRGIHWVEGHWVERNDWDRTSGYSSYFFSQLQHLNADSSTTSQFINPNATCPVCGAKVFFYKNTLGSKVYFDELGPPWPKHPCTDNDNYRKVKRKSIVKPTLRSKSQRESISSYIPHTYLSHYDHFYSNHNSKQWKMWEIKDKHVIKNKILLVLSSAETEQINVIYLSISDNKNELNQFINKNDFVFYQRGRLSCLNTDTLEPIKIKVKRITSASKYIFRLLELDE